MQLETKETAPYFKRVASLTIKGEENGTKKKDKMIVRIFLNRHVLLFKVTSRTALPALF